MSFCPDCGLVSPPPRHFPCAAQPMPAEPEVVLMNPNDDFDRLEITIRPGVVDMATGEVIPSTLPPEWLKIIANAPGLESEWPIPPGQEWVYGATVEGDTDAQG